MNHLYKLTPLLLLFIFNSCKTSEIKNGLKNEKVINVKDYLTSELKNHTSGFQNAFDTAVYRGIKKIYIPKGVYFLDKVNIYPGLEIYGEGRGKTVLKKIPNARKFSRMFTVQKQKIVTKDTLHIHDIEFDGSREDQGPYRKHQLEHQAMIFLGASNKSTEKLVAKISDCYFHDGCGDAIGLHRNTDVTVLNCEAKDVFRGGVTLTGGNSKLLVKGFKAWGDEHDTGIDIEIDGKGFENPLKVDIVMENIWLGGDFDIGTGRGGSFYGSNIYCDKPPVRIIGGPITIENSTFNTAFTKNCYINFPKDIRFNNCIFNIDTIGKKKVGYQAAFNIFWSKTKRKPENLKLSFLNCKFELIKKDADKRTYVIVNSPQQKGKNNILNFENCKINGDFDANFLIRGNGNFSINNTTSVAKRDYDLTKKSASPESYTFNSNEKKLERRVYNKDGSYEKMPSNF